MNLEAVEFHLRIYWIFHVLNIYGTFKSQSNIIYQLLIIIERIKMAMINIFRIVLGVQHARVREPRPNLGTAENCDKEICLLL